MANNEQLKEILRTEGELPEFLSWDNMQNGILTKLENAEELSSNKEKFKKRILIISFAFIAALIILYFFLNSNNKAQLDNDTAATEYLENNATQEKDIIESEHLVGEKDFNAAGTMNQTLEKSDDQSHTAYAASNLNLSKKSINPGLSNLRGQNQVTEKTKFSENQNTTKTYENLNGNNRLNPINNYTSRNQIIETSDNSKSDIATSYITALNLIQSGDLKQIYYQRPILNLQLENSLPSTPIVIQQPKRLGIEIGVGGNYFKTNFGNTSLGDAKASFNSGFSGLSGELLLSYPLSSKWKIKGGVSYQELVTKLDYHNNKEIFDNQDVVTLIEVNLINRDSTMHFENQAVKSVVWQRVLHYNTHKVISIPFSLHRNWAFKKGFEFTAGAGLQFNLLSSSSGKAIISEEGALSTYEIVDYENELYAINSSLNLMLITGLNYRLSEKMHLGIGLKGTRSLNDWSTSNKYAANPIVFESTFRLGYSF